MERWRFFDYITASGENLIQDWYDQQDADVRVAFDYTIQTLKKTLDWERVDVEEFKPCERHVGLGELRFHVMRHPQGSKNPIRIRFRPVGVWPPEKEREFVLILGCFKQRFNYTPLNAFDIALKHKAQLEKGRGVISERI